MSKSDVGAEQKNITESKKTIKKGTRSNKVFYVLGAIIFFLIIISFVLYKVTREKEQAATEAIQATEIQGSFASLKELDNILIRSKLLITKWYYVQTGDDAADKKALHYLLKNDTVILTLKTDFQLIRILFFEIL